MIQELIQLGKNIEKDFNLEKLPYTALEALENYTPTLPFSDFEEETAKWLLEQTHIPEQLNVYNSFGEPSLTVFNNGKFAVDIYFWRKNDTLIHSHAFRGAFKVLYGCSLHEEFAVEKKKHIQDDFFESTLETKTLEIFKEGSAQLILPGEELVHRVVHLENPTVTLCLRSVNDTSLQQWHHLPTGLSFLKHNLDPHTIKKLLYFQFLSQSNFSKAQNFLKQTLSTETLSEKLNIYESIYFDEVGLDENSSHLAIEMIHQQFENSPWFEHYTKHYENVNSQLRIHHAQTPALRLLAHAINCNYSLETTQKLLGTVTDSSISDLAKQLLLEKAVFSEEFLGEKRVRVEKWVNS